MTGLLQDIRTTFRTLAKSPGFTAAAVLTLALGIGANTAIFSVVDSVILQPLHFSGSGRLVAVWHEYGGTSRYPFSIPDFLDFRARNRTFERMAAYGAWNANLTGEAAPERLQGARVTADFFQMLGVQAALGRTLIPDDDTPGRPKVVVITHGMWQRRFGADRGIVGKKIMLNGDPYTVAGVLPPEFVISNVGLELFVPFVAATDPWRSLRSSISFLRVFGRLKPGVTLREAGEDCDSIAHQLAREYPQDDGGRTAMHVIPLRDEIVGNVRAMLLVVLGAVGLVLLMACANLASFLLARGSARRKEMAVRAALGGTRSRLVRQLLTESFTLSAAGGLLGAALSAWGVRGLLLLVPSDLPRSAEIQVDARMLLATLTLSVLCGILFGLLPALEASRIDLNDALRSDSRGSTGGRTSNRLRRVLVVAEVALSLVLLTGAGLLLKSFLRLRDVNPGFDARQALAIRLSLPLPRYAMRDATSALYDRLLPKLTSLPGVDSVGTTAILPLSGPMSSAPFRIAGRPAASPADYPRGQYRMVDPGYFAAMRIPILRGRVFSERDTEHTQTVAIASASLVRQYWPDRDPIGEHVKLDDSAAGPRDIEIVGVAADVRMLKLEDEPTPCMYVMMKQIPPDNARWIANNMFWVIRTSGPPAALAQAARRAVQEVDGDVAASSIQPVEQYLSNAVASQRFSVRLLAIFAGAALLLAATGLYALISHLTAQRRREIGVRMALGARPRDIFARVAGEGLLLTMTGVAAGLAGTFVATRLIATMLYGVTAHDVATILEVAALLAAVGGAASYFPARRALKVDPVAALREE